MHDFTNVYDQAQGAKRINKPFRNFFFTGNIRNKLTQMKVGLTKSQITHFLPSNSADSLGYTLSASTSAHWRLMDFSAVLKTFLKCGSVVFPKKKTFFMEVSKLSHFLDNNNANNLFLIYQCIIFLSTLTHCWQY